MHTQAYASWYATPQRVAYFINDFRCQKCICKRPAVSGFQIIIYNYSLKSLFSFFILNIA